MLQWANSTRLNWNYNGPHRTQHSQERTVRNSRRIELTSSSSDKDLTTLSIPRTFTDWNSCKFILEILDHKKKQHNVTMSQLARLNWINNGPLRTLHSQERTRRNSRRIDFTSSSSDKELATSS